MCGRRIQGRTRWSLQLALKVLLSFSFNFLLSSWISSHRRVSIRFCIGYGRAFFEQFARGFSRRHRRLHFGQFVIDYLLFWLLFFFPLSFALVFLIQCVVLKGRSAELWALRCFSFLFLSFFLSYMQLFLFVAKSRQELDHFCVVLFYNAQRVEAGDRKLWGFIWTILFFAVLIVF